MTPAQKLKIGKAIAKDIAERYRFSQSGKPEESLHEVLKHDKPFYPKGFGAFLDWQNSLFKQFSQLDVLQLLVEKKVIEEKELKAYMKQQHEIFQLLKNREALEELAKSELQQTLDLFRNPRSDLENKGTQEDVIQKLVIYAKRNKCLNLIAFLSFLKEKGKITTTQAEILSELEKLEDKQIAIEEKLEELKQAFLKKIEEKLRSGELKHALLNHPYKEKNRKTTLARAVPLNQVYPEKTKEQAQKEIEKFEKSKGIQYEATDIIGLDKITAKQFQALQFLAHKAQNQTDDEKKMLKIWDEVSGETHRGFRVIAFKTSEYITHSQGKDSSIVSDKEKVACIKAIEEIKNIQFTIRWEEKGKKEHVLGQHALIKTLNLNHPWTLVKEQKDAKEIKKFQFIAIPERLFEYKEVPDKDKKYKGAKVLFDVINVDPDFFTRLKYSDPEIKHVSDSLMKLSLMFLIEGSFGRTEFVIDEKKLLNRIGLTNDNNRHIGRAKNTLNTYVTKLINHGTLEAEEKKENQRVFKFPKKESQ